MVAASCVAGGFFFARSACAQVRDLNDAIDKAGRQRMLSQRMAAMALGVAWGVDVEQSLRTLATAREEFVKAHDTLASAPQATQAARAGLELASQQWGFYDLALRNVRGRTAEPRQLGDLFTTSERILQAMEEVTGQFSRLG